MRSPSGHGFTRVRPGSIPGRYGCGMATTSQITIRVPSDLVDWLDAEVTAGRAASRAAGIARLLARARRYQEAEADLLILAAAPPDPDEESRLDWMRTRSYPPLDDDDSAAPPVTPGAAPSPRPAVAPRATVSEAVRSATTPRRAHQASAANARVRAASVAPRPAGA